MKKLMWITLMVTAVLSSCSSREDKIVYIQNYRLYNEFDLTKELNLELTEFSKKKQRELDSLNLIFEDMTARFEIMDQIPADDYRAYNDLRNAIMFRQKAYEDELYAKSSEYDEQVWTRLNTYTREFSEQNDYDFVLGATGTGNLMYAKDTLDVTDELITYCNNNYSGKP